MSWLKWNIKNKIHLHLLQFLCFFFFLILDSAQFLCAICQRDLITLMPQYLFFISLLLLQAITLFHLSFVYFRLMNHNSYRLNFITKKGLFSLISSVLIFAEINTIGKYLLNHSFCKQQEWNTYYIVYKIFTMNDFYCEWVYILPKTEISVPSNLLR